MTVKEAKVKLQSLLDELNEVDENATFDVELDDNCGGSYPDDISRWSLEEIKGEIILSNF